jgi:hypothetical protein
MMARASHKTPREKAAMTPRQKAAHVAALESIPVIVDGVMQAAQALADLDAQARRFAVAENRAGAQNLADTSRGALKILDNASQTTKFQFWRRCGVSLTAFREAVELIDLALQDAAQAAQKGAA